jgi:hypothetical protein
VSQKPTGESCGARWAVTTPAEASGPGTTEGAPCGHPAVSVAPLSRQARRFVRLAHHLPSEARLRDAWPQEDTSHDPRAPKAHAQLVPASEPR